MIICGYVELTTSESVCGNSIPIEESNIEGKFAVGHVDEDVTTWIPVPFDSKREAEQAADRVRGIVDFELSVVELLKEIDAIGRDQFALILKGEVADA